MQYASHHYLTQKPKGFYSNFIVIHILKKNPELFNFRPFEITITQLI